MTDLLRVLAWYRPLRSGLVLLSILTVAAVVFEAAALITLVPLLQELVDISDGVSGSLGPFEVAVGRRALIAAAATAVALSGLTQGSVVYLRSHLAAKWLHRQRLALLDAYETASWKTQSKDREGRLVGILADHVGQGAIAMNHVAGLMRGLAGLTVFVVGALIIDPMAATAVVITGALLVAGTRPIVRAGRRTSSRLSQLNVAIVESLASRTSSNLDLRAFGVEDRGGEQFRSIAQDGRHHLTWSAFLSGIGSIIYRTAGLAMVVIVAAIALTVDDLPVARMGVATLLLFRGISYGQLLQQSHQRISEVAPYLELFGAELDRYHRDRRSRGTRTVETIERIELEAVSYRPDLDDDAIVRDVSLSIGHGECIGLVGPSGAGKTTLALLIVGIIEPTSGRALLGDIDAVELSPESRQRSIAWVSQDARPLPGSIRENVCFHRDGIDDESILTALHAAGLDPLLASMPDGIDTVIGSGGRNLSGGQQQRLSIARALAGDPDLIVLDEPTSALDIDAEAIVSDTIAALKGRATTIVIAHRAATVAGCDRIVTMSDGRIEYDGCRSGSGRSAFAGRLLGTSSRAGGRE